MEISKNNKIHQVIDLYVLIASVILLSANNVYGKKDHGLKSEGGDQYAALNCRAHSASLTDFGGVGDGKTSNTKAFQEAIKKLSQYESQGGSELIVPPGKWLTSPFNLTSHFTLYLHKDAVLLASEVETEWETIAPLPSYGLGRDATEARYISLIFGTNLTDVVITGDNGTIDGQGKVWWDKFKKNELKFTRPYLIEIMFSTDVQISNITLLNSPNWNVHPIYCSNVIIQGITILADLHSPNTDGINPDSCTNTRIEDCYIESGDDCVAVKSGWDQYGIKFGMPTKQLVIRRLTCISPTSAMIALGSEMSGGIEDVRVEDITAINTESAVRIKTAVGRGAFVRDIYVRGMTLNTMNWVFWIAGNYGQHPDNNTDLNAIPVVENINYQNVIAKNVTMAGRLEGIPGHTFKGICISNVTIEMAPSAPPPIWNCTDDISGMTTSVTPPPCPQLAAKGPPACKFLLDKLPIENVKLQTCPMKAAGEKASAPTTLPSATPEEAPAAAHAEKLPILRGRATLAVPELNAPLVAPELKAPLAAPGLNAPLAAPGLNAPLTAPALNAPFAAPGLNVPLAAPGLNAPLAAPGLNAPLTAPRSNAPAAAPEEKAPAAAPEEKSPATALAEKLHILRGRAALADPIENAVSPTPGLNAPLTAPGLNAPLAAPGLNAPLAAPGLNAPLTAPGLNAPLTAPGLNAPLVAPKEKAPAAALAEKLHILRGRATLADPVENVASPAPGLNAPLAAPGLNAPLAAPVLNAPLAAPGLNAPLAAPGLNAPLAAPVLNAPLAAPGLNAPLAAPGLNTPLTAPGSNAPLAAPRSDAP